jgi:hypothetical protein
MKRFGINNGIDSKFKKGQAPHNKGKKMSKEMYEKLRPTMFQKGCCHNARPVGTERVDRDGYVRIKVAQPNKWELKHVVVWESYYGKVPEGHLVIFLDGDKHNFDIDNLQIITLAENLFLNKKRMRFNDKELTSAAVNVAKVTSIIQKKRKDD